MTEDRKIIRAEVGLLGLAKQLGNVAQAGGMMGHGRDSLSRSKELRDRGGAPAPREPSRREPLLKDRVAPGIGAAVVRPGDRARPAWGQLRQLRVSNERPRRGLTIAPFGVRGVWGRHDLTTRRHRLKALEAKRMAQERFIPTGSQLAALGRAEADEGPRGGFGGECPGYGGARDTFPVGTLEGVGRVHRQTVIDTYAEVGFAKPRGRGTPLTAADLPDDRVIPFHDGHGPPRQRILTEAGGPSTAVAATATGTSSIPRSGTSITAAPRRRARGPTASSSGSTKPSPTSAIGSPPARRSATASRRARPTSTPGWRGITGRAPIRAATASERRRCGPSSTPPRPPAKNSSVSRPSRNTAPDHHPGQPSLSVRSNGSFYSRLENLPGPTALKRMMATMVESCSATASPRCRAASCWTSTTPRIGSTAISSSPSSMPTTTAATSCRSNIYEAITGKPVAVILRAGKAPDGTAVARVLRHVIGRLRARWPRVEILVRGDSHYGRPEAMSWCERHRVGYIFGLAGNKVLLRAAAGLAEAATLGRVAGESEKVRRYGEFRYAAKTWDVERRVIARVEASPQGADSRFVVTNLAGAPRWLYEAVYCARGQAENLIKAHKRHPGRRAEGQT